MNANKNFTEGPVVLPDTQQQDRVLERPQFWARHRILVIALAVVIVGLAALGLSLLHFSGAQSSVDRSRVTIATVTRGSFVRDVVADGQVVAAVSPTLYASSAGNVTLKVHAGDAVEKDQVVAEIDSPDLSAKRSQEEATLQSLLIDWKRAQLESERKLAQLRDAYQQAEIDQTAAQRELDRSRKAYELGSYSELQTLRSQDALAKARFAYEQAKKNYESQPEQNRFDIESRKALLDRQQYLVTELRRQIDGLQVRSPVIGKVGQVQIDDRESVSKDTPLLTVIDLSALEVEIKVPESLARDLTSGMTADLEGSGHKWKGIVGAVSPQVVNGEVTARLRFADEKPEGLRQSQRLSVRIFIDKRNNVLMVDRGLFVEQDGGGFAYLVRGNIAERHAVRLGAVGVQKVEIAAGLAQGDQIVISGTDAFRGAERVILSH
jgi:HlyD family secretion protein